MDALEGARAALRSWMFDLALPFWCAHGFRPAAADGATAAAEHLTLSGEPSHPGYTRMRVQARQLFVFSIAAERGVHGAAARADGLFRFILRHGRSNGGGWVRRLRPDGAPLDDTADLYDMAFVLFAFAHHARVTGDRQPLREAAQTLDFIRTRMTHPQGGFGNALPVEPGWRLQNPHMHLLEAAHALFQAGGGDAWAELAGELASLFHRRFLDPATGTLAENFTDALRRAGGVDGDLVEPGHQVEWIWLLDRQQFLFGGPAPDAAIGGLARVCEGQGVGTETGLMRDAISRDGRLLRGTSRLWPQTELLRAGCVLHRRADTVSDSDAALRLVLRTANNLLNRFLVGAGSVTPPPGTWIDQLDAFGLPAVHTIPTSSFYHIMTAWIELEDLRSSVPLAAPAR